MAAELLRDAEIERFDLDDWWLVRHDGPFPPSLATVGNGAVPTSGRTCSAVRRSIPERWRSQSLKGYNVRTLTRMAVVVMIVNAFRGGVSAQLPAPASP
jgi:hypothetical protein